MINQSLYGKQILEVLKVELSKLICQKNAKRKEQMISICQLRRRRHNHLQKNKYNKMIIQYSHKRKLMKGINLWLVNHGWGQLKNLHINIIKVKQKDINHQNVIWKLSMYMVIVQKI